ncbi:hypothetical protein ACKWTF_016925 [Chironomus riparius]
MDRITSSIVDLTRQSSNSNWIHYQSAKFYFQKMDKCWAMLSDEEFIKRAPQIGSILHAQLEIWKATYVDISSIDNGNSLTSVAGPSSAVPTMSNSLSQTSIWNQMLHDETDVSDVC